MELFQTLLPAFIFGGEVVVLVTLFLSIRFHGTAGLGFTIFELLLAAATLVCIKSSLTLAYKVTDMSREFSKLPQLNYSGINKDEGRFSRSCAPLRLKVGKTFTITRETLPHILQRIIIENLISLLVFSRRK
jgi:hypothetical protein